jgi:D-proline reductase (dithiol) PrdB
MACFEDLRLSHRLFMQSYRYRSADWSPGARLTKPLQDATLALITTAGLHLPTQPPFGFKVRGGDFSFREIPNDVDVTDLQISHRSSAFDRSGALQDRNVVFPLDRLRELVEQHELGALNHRHFSFMGSITAPGRLIAISAPALADMLRRDSVDAVLLVPA